jgi:acetyltransferase
VKPVVTLVVGRADVGDFARSHTGALATAWRTTRAVLAHAGAVLVDDERELVDAVGQLSLTRLTPAPDPGVALVTAQAGPGLLVLDELRHHGVRLPELGEATQAAVGELLPPLTYQANPVDTGRPGDSFADVLATVSADPEIDLVAVYALSEPDAFDLGEAARTAGRAVTMALGGPEGETAAVRERLHAEGVAVHPSPSSLAAGIRALVTDARLQHWTGLRVDTPRVPPAAADLLARQDVWTEHDAKLLLDALGVATPRRRVCTADRDALDALRTLRPPLAVKLLDAAVLHKTEVGGVHLGVRSPEQLTRALADLRAVGASRFLIEEMAEDGVDLIVGARRDPVFGPVVLVGLGGSVAEALADVALRAAPLSPREARELPDELLGAALLRGWRGGPVLDADELARTVCLLGQVVVEHPHLEEIEINPLRLTRHGLVALDAVITTRSSDGQQHP